MAKDPAFLFYPGDWLGGTLGMTFEEKGAYMEVLMLQFNRGHMEGHMVGQVVGQIWDKIRHKFQQDEKGLWFNVRLELEITRRKSFIDSRKNNLTGKNQHGHKEGRMGGHMTNHMENENKDENKDVSEERKVQEGKQKKIPESVNQVSDYMVEYFPNNNLAEIKTQADLFWNHFCSNGWLVGKAKSPMKDWKAAARNWILRKDEFKQQTNGKPTAKVRDLPRDQRIGGISIADAEAFLRGE